MSYLLVEFGLLNFPFDIHSAGQTTESDGCSPALTRVDVDRLPFNILALGLGPSGPHHSAIVVAVFYGSGVEWGWRRSR
jgi:hypothetical protein